MKFLYFRKTFLYFSSYLGLSKQDVILTSYPRSGNTWVRFFFCNIISLKELKEKKINFRVLNRIMPEFGNSNLIKKWNYSVIPRIVKTHKKCWPIFKNKKSILLIRDPRDVVVSYYHYKKYRNNSFNGKFEEFIKSSNYGLPSWFEHYNSWKNEAGLIIEYENLKRDDIKEFKRILDYLNIKIEDKIIKEAAQKSSFKNVKKTEKERSEKSLEEKSRFTRSGKTKQWQDWFGSSLIKYYKSLKQKHGVNIY